MEKCFLILALAAAGLLKAQNSGEFYRDARPCDGKTSLQHKRPAPLPFVREADLAWQKRIWRDLELKEKLNLPLFYPTDYLPCRRSLFQVISAELLRGTVRAFADDEFTIPYTAEEISRRLRPKDTIIRYAVDEEGNMYEEPAEVTDSVSIFQRVIKWRIKEDWYFDRQRSQLEVRIVGLAPFEWVEEKEAWRELFWVYFPSCRISLAREAAFNRANDREERSFDEIFLKRMFSSVVVKESNVFDRYLSEFERGIDALTEAEKIKMEIFKWEHDLWNY